MILAAASTKTQSAANLTHRKTTDHFLASKMLWSSRYCFPRLKPRQRLWILHNSWDWNWDRRSLAFWWLSSRSSQIQLPNQAFKWACHEHEAVDESNLMFDFYFFFCFFFVDVFANQDVYAKADVFFYITGNTFDISFIVIPRFLMNKCES